MYMFSHTEEVVTPRIIAILSKLYGSSFIIAPGDIIGNSALDDNQSRSLHYWIVNYDECDLLLLPTDYLNVTICFNIP
jgi:hypothetical protein